MKVRSTNKGFTLVEILVVLLIIGIISILAVPNINNMRNGAKSNAYNKKLSMIKLAAENYVLDNKNKLIEQCKSGSSSQCTSCGQNCYNVRVKIGDLVSSGELKTEGSFGGSNCTVHNPIDSTCMDYMSVSVKISGQKYTSVVSKGISVSKPKMTAVEYIYDLAKTSNPNPGPEVVINPGSSDASCTNTLAYDGTADNSLRYVGGNPCNYVSFNGELWRMIGAINNVENGSGTKETRVKLIRKDYLGGYQFDKDGTGHTRSNDWSKSYLMQELNGDYLNYNLTEDTKWYASTAYNIDPPEMRGYAYFDHTKTLKKDAQKLIGDAKWQLGAITSVYGLSLYDGYAMERGTLSWGTEEGQECNDDSCPRATEWIGKVGLMYPTDARLSPNGHYSRIECLTISFNTGSSNCNSSYNYLLTSQWSITPGLSKNSIVTAYAYSDVEDVKTNHAVFPVVYLKSNVKIVSGKGSQSNPYILK